MTHAYVRAEGTTLATLAASGMLDRVAGVVRGGGDQP
jgi:hypothetical protein